MRTTVARSFAEAEALRPAWESFAWPRIDAEPDYFLAVAHGREEVVRPHIVLVERDGRAAGMLVARVEDVPLRCSVGYKTVLAPTVRSLGIVYGGCAGADNPEVARALLDEVARALAAREADVALLPALATGSPLHALATSAPPRRRRGRTAPPATHRRLALPATYDEFLASRARKTRQSINRYANRFTKEYGDRIAVRRYDDPANIDAIFEQAEAIAAKTYQRGLGVAFADDAEHRTLVALGLERGWFRCYVLTLDGRPVAFWPGYVYGGTFFSATPGYDPEFAEHRVGNFLLMRMIEEFCGDPAVRALDYGFGDSEYKRRFGSDETEEADVLIFAPTARALALNAVRGAVLGAADAGRRALGDGRTDKLKRAWRERLAARAAARASA